MISILLSLIMIGSWTESFETQDYFPPNNWLVVNEDALDARLYRTALDGNTGAHSATCCADYALYQINNQDWLITPRVQPQIDDTMLSFACKATGSEPCTLDIMVALRCSIPSFEVLHTLPVTNSTWTIQSQSLTAYSGTPIYVAFRIRYVPQNGQLWLDDITLPAITNQPLLCNGRLRVKALESEMTLAQNYLQVWGNHYEMGYAHGFLLAEEVMASSERLMVGNTQDHIFSPTRWENTILPYYRVKYTVPQKYLDEAQGLLDGMKAKGVNMIHTSLGREITIEDIICSNAMGDIIIMGCSSVSGWGESTINDDTLAGGLVIARNLDFYPGQFSTSGNVSVIVAHLPEVQGEQPFFNCTMAGCFAFISGVNQQGVGLAVDFCYRNDTAGIEPNSLEPFCLSARNAVETYDPDQNGVSDIFDIPSVIHCTTSLRSWGVHLFSPYDSTHLTPAAILEINNIGDSLRYVRDNNLPPAINSQWNLGLTNHERVLYPPYPCDRYFYIAESLNSNFELTTERAINIMKSTNQGNFTVHQLYFRPNILRDQPDLPGFGVSLTRRGRGANMEPKVCYSWNELFEGMPSSINEYSVSRTVNRVTHATIIHGMLYLHPAISTERSDVSVYLLDITGRKVADLKSGANNIRHLAPGVYFIRSNINNQVTKIIVTR